jgi:hypothetical protein
MLGPHSKRLDGARFSPPRSPKLFGRSVACPTTASRVRLPLIVPRPDEYVAIRAALMILDQASTDEAVGDVARWESHFPSSTR